MLCEMGMMARVLRAGMSMHGDRARADIGRVAAVAIVRKSQHVAFRLAGGDSANDLQRFGIDDGDGSVELRGDVEQAISRSDERHVRAHAVAEVNGPYDLLRGNIV